MRNVELVKCLRHFKESSSLISESDSLLVLLFLISVDAKTMFSALEEVGLSLDEFEQNLYKAL